MSRPQPVILTAAVDAQQHVEQVLEVAGLWAVLYDSAPFSLKSTSNAQFAAQHKYKPTVFVNRAPAENLARKLNATFACTLFTVEQIWPR